MSGPASEALYTEPNPTPWLGRRMAPEEFLTLPEFKPYLELDRGVVVQKPYADPTHGRLQPALARYIESHAAKQQLGMTFIELTTCFAGSVVIPDVAYLSFERLPFDPEEWQLRDDMLGAPDIAAEIMYVGQPRAPVARRCSWYVANGVLRSLLVDPDGETVSVFRPRCEPVVLRGNDRINLGDVLPGFELTAGMLLLHSRPGLGLRSAGTGFEPPEGG